MLSVIAVESSIKDGVSCRLAEKTLVVGPNATGKSALVASVELPLSARVSDLVGRAEVAREVDLMALAPARTKELFARAYLSDGSQSSWTAGGKGKGKKAKHLYPPSVDPDAVFPLRRVREAVLGSVETARKFFLHHAIGGISDADVLKRIPANLHSRYKQGLLISSASTATDKLLAVLEHAKREARAANDRAKAHLAASGDAAQGLAPLPTEEVVAELKKRHKTAAVRLEQLVHASGATEAHARAAENLAKATQDRIATEHALTEREATYRRTLTALENAPQPVAYDPDVEGVIRALRWHLAAAVATPTSEHPCLCCGAGSVTAQAFAARLALAENYVQGNAATQATWNTLRLARDDAARAFETAQTLLASARATEASLQSLVQSAVGVEQPAALDAVRAQVAEAEVAIAEVERLRAAWSTTMRARESAVEADKDSKEWKELMEACTETVGQLLDTGVTQFVARVQGFLPPTDQFTLTLRDGTREVFQFGLVKNGVLHTALAGIEWVRVTAALAAACMPPVGQLAIIIPEDKAFDPVTLSAVLLAFSKVEGQVIVTSTVYPSPMPEGWLVIDTGRGEHFAGIGNLPTKVVPTGNLPVESITPVLGTVEAVDEGQPEPAAEGAFDPPPSIATW